MAWPNSWEDWGIDREASAPWSPGEHSEPNVPREDHSGYLLDQARVEHWCKIQHHTPVFLFLCSLFGLRHRAVLFNPKARQCFETCSHPIRGRPV